MRKALFVLAAALSLWLAPNALASGWCGSGESSTDLPDATAGRQVHAVVAVPSDGPDTFSTDAPRVADDVASLESWWIGQDPTRVPRFDEAKFGSQTCLDISFVRLPNAGTSFTNAPSAFDAIANDLVGIGLGSIYKKYLVYYDGPAPEPNVCGVGGGDLATGPSFAIVVLAGCPGVPNDTVATHELLHALGALPPGAPHACPGDPGHPCDSPTDVLYPYTHGEPLSQKVLDYNHDDYYAHSGTWPDIQDSLWLRHLDTPLEPLTVALTGAGSVASDVPGVACTTGCVTQWDQGSLVSLSAEPGAASRFVGWRGACTGNAPCSVTLNSAESVTAVFGPLRIALHLRVVGKGRIVCAPICAKTIRAGNPLALRAVPAKGWRFTGWTGGCQGKQAACAPKTDFSLSIRASFKRRSH